MHDHLRDMGRVIVVQQCEDPGKRSRLWKLHEAQQVIEEYQVRASPVILTYILTMLLKHRSRHAIMKLTAILNFVREQKMFDALDGGELDKEFILHTQCLSSMRSLRLLWLKGATIQVDFAKLYFPNLRWLKLEFCSGLKWLRSGSIMEHLAILDLNGSDVKELWNKNSRVILHFRVQLIFFPPITGNYNIFHMKWKKMHLPKMSLWSKSHLFFVFIMKKLSDFYLM
eukprot:Gb_05401 [translate_table: standard]